LDKKIVPNIHLIDTQKVWHITRDTATNNNNRSNSNNLHTNLVAQDKVEDSNLPSMVKELSLGTGDKPLILIVV
jgi:hypothetical protein